MSLRRLTAVVVLAVIVAVASIEVLAHCDTALFVIDVQKLWVEEDGWFTIDELPIVDSVAAVLESAREVGLPVIFVKDVSADYATAAQLGFPDAIAPQEDEIVIEKLNRSAFEDTALQPVLEERGITRLLITGIASDACVSATVNAARDHGYEVLIVADAHSGGSNGKIAAFRNRMWAGWGISVVPTADIDFAAICAPERSAPE